MNNFKKIIEKLLFLIVILIILPVNVQAIEERDILLQIDSLTDGLNEEQLEGIKRLVGEKIEAARNRQRQASAVMEKSTTKKNEPLKDSKLQMELGNRFFFYNLEGSHYELRNARTFFGSILYAKLSYKLGDNARIKGGAVFILPFAERAFDLRWGDYIRDFQDGDHSKKKVNLIQPYIQLRYNYQNFGFVIGDLETPHDFHKLVVYDVYEFLRPTEKGIQILYDNQHISQDLFINWREKNTPGHHERFNLGSISKLKWKDGSLALQLLYVHRGGVEFPQDPIVFENISAALVFDHSISVKKSFIDRAGFELVPMYTHDKPVDHESGSNVDGFGALGSIYVTFGDWMFKSGYWMGNKDVFAEEGIPFSRQERFVYSELIFNKKLKYDINARVLLTGGLFGKKLKDNFFDQKVIISWKRAFDL